MIKIFITRLNYPNPGSQKAISQCINGRQYKLFRKQVQYFDRQIDTLVYQLYGLTKGEIKIWEEAG